jgi:MFS family permease
LYYARSTFGARILRLDDQGLSEPRLIASLSNIKHSCFHYAPFRHLFFARLLTVLGNGIAPIALAFAVLDMGGSAADLGIVVAARSIFNVVFLLVGGVVADRYTRSKVLLWSCVIAGMSQAVVAVMVLDGSATLFWLAMLGMVNGAAAGIALPASSSMVPQTVPEKKLRAANAFIQSGVYAGTIMGASLGGLLISAVGPGWGLAVDGLGFMLAAPLYLAIRPIAVRKAMSQSNPFRDLRDGWDEFISRSWVWSIVAQFAIVNTAFTGVMMILGPVVADQSFGRAAWGAMVAAQSVGLMTGSFLALRWRPRRDLLIGVVGIVASALPLICLAAAVSTPILVLAFFLAGVSFGQFGVIWSHSLQLHVPADKLARVYAYDAVGSFIAIPIGELAAGPLAQYFGNELVLYACAIAVFLATVVTSFTPSIRHLDNRNITSES